MGSARWCIGVALAFAFCVRGASAAPPAAVIPSYTEAQADRGEILYYENCAECHGATLGGNFGPALTGGNGNLQWQPLTSVWTYILGHMPAGNAGGLPPADYVEIMAFILKRHGNPPGAKPLTAKAAAASKAPIGP